MALAEDRAISVGDMLVAGSPPPKLLKALAAIASGLHEAFDADPRIVPGISRQSCVLCSLAIRDFLFRIGFRDAEAVPVAVAIRAFRDGKEIHSLGIGATDMRQATRIPGRWDGHMVAVLPSAGWLVDATLYPARREAWRGLPGMAAVPLLKDAVARPFGLVPVAGLAGTFGEGDADVEVLWLEHRANRSWKDGPDASRRRREAAVAALAARFGAWSEG